MVSKQIRLKSREARYRMEAHLTLQGWVPVKVGKYGGFAAGYGVRHEDTRMLTYRSGCDDYMFAGELIPPETIAEVNWVQLSSGLFWTIIDWFERKGCWDGREPT